MGKSGATISLSRDLTPLQRKHLRKIHLELTERREKGEQDLTIRHAGGEPLIVKRGKATIHQTPT